MKNIFLLFSALFAVQFAQAQNRTSSVITFKSGKEIIEGVLVRPKAEGKVPAVVFQQGSGAHSFEGYETKAWGPHKFYIEDLLLEQGYAVLYCNKRGLGNSTGNWKSNSFHGRANDAYAAVEYLKSRPDIDGSRIGLSGHSQGGWIAQIVAAKHDDIAFVLSLAGPTVNVKEQTAAYDSLMYLCKGYPADKIAEKMQKYRKRKKNSARMGKIFPFIGSARHWNLIYNYNHDEIITKIKCPTLLLFAEHDANVPPSQNLAHFKRLFGENAPENFTIKVMKGGQHGFYKVDNYCVDWDTATKQGFDPDFQGEIRDWLKGLAVEN